MKHIVPTNQSDCLKQLYSVQIMSMHAQLGKVHAYHSAPGVCNGESTSLFTSVGCFGHGDYFMSVKLTLLFTGNQVSET